MKVSLKSMGINVSIVSQTQTGINNSYADYDDYDDEEVPITGLIDGTQFDESTKQMNNVFDDTDEYLSDELKSIINHRLLSSVLEFQV